MSQLLPSPAKPNSVQASDAGQPRLSGYLLALARAVWLGVAAVALAGFILSLPIQFAQLEQVCTGPSCDVSLRPQDLPVLAQWGLSPTSFAAFGTVLMVMVALVWMAMGLLLFWRQSAEPRALFFALFLVVSDAGPSPTLAVRHPGWWLPVTAYGFLQGACLILFAYLFPNAQFVPRWTRWLALAWLLVDVPLDFFPHAPLSRDAWPDAISFPVTVSLYGSFIVAQVYRYRRRSTSVERQQTKWVMLALSMLVLLLGFGLTRLLTGEATPLWAKLAFLTSLQLTLLLIPLAIAIAISRYRLWAIDALINKALVYGLLTVLLAAIYAGLIIGLQGIVRSLAGESGSQSPPVIVVSTLAIAALFLPARQRIQQLIDRRFYRRKYDAEQTLTTFSAMLRQDVDLEHVQRQLLAVVQETMQVSLVWLWLRAPEPHTGHPDGQRGLAAGALADHSSTERRGHS